MIGTSVVLAFVLYPSLSTQAFGLFNCYEVDSNEEWLYADLGQRCWEGDHFRWAVALGGLMILTVVIPFLFFAYFIVQLNTSKLEDPSFIMKFRILF